MTEPRWEPQPAWETRATGSAPGTSRPDPSTNGHRPDASVHPIREAGDVQCTNEVDLVLFRFASFGRLAHFRRSLQRLPFVSSVRISSYSGQTALFSVTVRPGTASQRLVLPGTRLIASDGRRVELCVEA